LIFPHSANPGIGLTGKNVGENRAMTHRNSAIVGIVLFGTCLSTGGCLTAIDQYYTSAKHYKFGTAKVRRVAKPVERAYEAALTVLEQKGWGVSSKELSSESALIRANRNERSLVFDIKGDGDASTVRLEIDQSGNEAETWSLLNELDMLP
jgi:hypothetical protein